ncbi:MAG: DUF2163 domain-containing protein [Rhodobacteraceae bacterium]|nr:DUF2163 domain-containing protein [Paracoccaceae bacterium]
MAVSAALQAHLDTGTTTLCRCWRVRRRDGVLMGFTDHDLDLSFDGTVFRADTGLTAQALQQTTGLSVDNTEALGALSSSAVTEADLAAGRFDGAEVESWLVNWSDVLQRHLTFKGTLGEVVTSGGQFRAELRGQSEVLNRARGRAFQPLCSADLGDVECGVDLDAPGVSGVTTVAQIKSAQNLVVAGLDAYTAALFERGRLEVLSGAAQGLKATIKSDTVMTGARELVLWEEVRAAIAVGDQVRLRPGCNKRAETCRTRFNNFLNFRGFPHIPGEDWLMAYPTRNGRNDGGSRNR